MASQLLADLRELKQGNRAPPGRIPYAAACGKRGETPPVAVNPGSQTPERAERQGGSICHSSR